MIEWTLAPGVNELLQLHTGKRCVKTSCKSCKGNVHSLACLMACRLSCKILNGFVVTKEKIEP